MHFINIYIILFVNNKYKIGNRWKIIYKQKHITEFSQYTHLTVTIKHVKNVIIYVKRNVVNPKLII